MRIYEEKIQKQIFKLLGLSEEDTKEKFGHFIQALGYGTPQHGGMALGLDRIIMILAGTENIKDVVPFPKTTSATDLMAHCPSKPLAAQIDELHFDWKKR